MNNDFSIRYELTDADRRAAWQHLFHEANKSASLSYGRRALASLGMIILAVAIIAPAERGLKVTGGVLGALVITAAVVRNSIVPQEGQLRQQAGSHKLTISPDGLVVQSGLNSTTTPWQDVEHVVIGSAHLFIHGRQDVLCIVPTHVFSDLDESYRLQQQIEWYRHMASMPIAGAPENPPIGSPFAPPPMPDDKQLLHARLTELRREHLKAETRIKIQTVLLTSLYLVVCLFMLFTLADKDKDQIDAGLILLAWPATAGLIGLPISLGVLLLRPWARLPLTIWAVAGLLFCPFGTMLAAGILAQLISIRSPALLTADYARIASETADLARSETSKAWGWAGLMAFLLTMLAILLLIAKYA